MIEICHEQDNAIVAHIPVSAIKINIVVPREMTEEEKEAARARLSQYRNKQSKNAEPDEMEEELDISEEDIEISEEIENDSEAE